MLRLRHAPYALLWTSRCRVVTVTTHSGCWQGVTMLPWSLRAVPYDVRVGLN